jgi:hypothetical protein
VTAAAPDEQRSLEVALSEFKALRDEIGQRATFSHTLININAVATGVIGGLVVNNPGRVIILLVPAVFSPVLGLLWLDHAHSIRNMGDYINQTLRPLVCALAGDKRLLGWEEHVDQYEQRKWLRLIPLGVPVLVLFAGVPVAALARTAGHLETAWDWLLWVAAVLLTGCFLVLCGRLMVLPLVTARAQSALSPR